MGIVIAPGGAVGLAEGIIDDTHVFLHNILDNISPTDITEHAVNLLGTSIVNIDFISQFSSVWNSNHIGISLVNIAL